MGLLITFFGNILSKMFIVKSSKIQIHLSPYFIYFIGISFLLIKLRKNTVFSLILKEMGKESLELVLEFIDENYQKSYWGRR